MKIGSFLKILSSKLLFEMVFLFPLLINGAESWPEGFGNLSGRGVDWLVEYLLSESGTTTQGGVDPLDLLELSAAPSNEDVQLARPFEDGLMEAAGEPDQSEKRRGLVCLLPVGEAASSVLVEQFSCKCGRIFNNQKGLSAHWGKQACVGVVRAHQPPVGSPVEVFSVGALDSPKDELSVAAAESAQAEARESMGENLLPVGEAASSAPVGQFNHVCPTCGLGFKNRKGLSAHWGSRVCVKVVRAYQPPVGSPVDVFSVGALDSPKDGLIAEKEKLQADMQGSLEECLLVGGAASLPSVPEFNHFCDKCSCWFGTFKELFEHRRKKECQAVAAADQSKAKTVQCKVCLGNFSTKWNLQRHMHIHTGVRPYVCPKCPASFCDRASLRGHLERHLK